MVWQKGAILEKLRELHKAEKDISYNALCRKMQPLLSAAAYHFGSYRKAVQQAGIDYGQVSRRPRWTKKQIIQLIKQARRRSEDLSWSAVTRRGDELARAAFAAIQPRLFGKWERALSAAGLDSDMVSRYRKWDRQEIVFEIRQYFQAGESLNSGAMQQEDPGLHAAAVRHFGTYDAAILAAKIDPAKVRQRRSWDKQQVITMLKAAERRGEHLSDSAIRQNNPPLYGAAVRLFGSFTKARDSAGLRI